MILKDIGRGIRSIGRSVRKVISWALGVPKPKDPRGMEIMQEGSDLHEPVVYGERLVGGKVVHKWVTNSISGISGIQSVNRDNAYLHLIVTFAHGEVEEIGTVYFNGEPQTVAKYGNAYAIFRRNGSDTQTAIPQAVQNINNWFESARGRGVAYTYIVLYQDKDQQIWQGEPEIQAIIKGRKVYDPRTEQVAYSQNPALAALDYLTNNIYGRGLPLSRIDLPAFIEAANFCDEGTSSTVTRTTCVPDDDPNAPPVCTTETITVNQPRYLINAIIDTQAEVFNNYRELLQVFRAYPRRPNGKVSLFVEDVAPAEFPVFEEGELIGAISYQLGGQKDRFNRFTIRFPNRLDRYERDEFTYPQSDDPLFEQWLEEDNGKELVGELELNTISDTACAAQNAEVAAKVSRLSGKLAIRLPRRARLLEAGDIFGLNSPRYGWVAKPFRITRIAEAEDGSFEVDAKEHEDAAYPWSGASWDEQIGGSWLGNPDEIPQVTGVQIQRDQTYVTSGIATWNPVGSAFIDGYQVTVYDTEDDSEVFSQFVRSSAASIPMFEAGIYRIEVQARNRQQRLGEAGVADLFLLEPSNALSLGLSASNTTVTVEPELDEDDLGLECEFDIDDLSDPLYQPTPRKRGRTAVFTDRIPATEYRVWVRVVNNLGFSDWISSIIETTENEAEWPFLQQIRDDIEDSEGRIDDADERINELDRRQANPIGINEILDVSVNDILETWRAKKDVDRETERRIVDINRIEVEIDDVAFAINERIDGVEVDVDGNASAISGLTLSVGNLQTDLTATINRVDQVEIDADNNANAISVIQGQVNDPVNNTSALYGFVQQAQTTANGNTQSITLLTNRVEANEDFADAQLLLNAFYDEELDVIGSRAFLGTNVNGQVTGINIEDIAGEQRIEFISNATAFLDAGGQEKIFFDLAEGEYVFDGVIIARGGQFTGTVEAADIIGGTITGATVSAVEFLGGSIKIGGTLQNPNFSVSEQGDVFANSIELVNGQIGDSTIIGGDIIGTSINIGSGVFTVDELGALTATDATITGTITAIDGDIGGWEITSTVLRSAPSGSRIELNPVVNRISVFDSVNEKVAMGFLGGLPKFGGGGNWTASDYGFWARQGDNLIIDGNVEYVNGNWLIENDATLKIQTSAGHDVINLGTNAGNKGLFIFDGTSGRNLRAEFRQDRIFAGSAGQSIEWTPANGLVVSGTVTASDFIGGSVTGATITGGTLNIGNGNFTVNSSGVLSATGANISGTITTGAGSVGGFNIGNTSIASQIVAGKGRLFLNSLIPQIMLQNSASQNVGIWNENQFFTGSSTDYINWTASNGLEISGDIVGSSFVGGVVELPSANTIQVMSSTPFGPNNLIYWFGDKSSTTFNSATGRAILSGLTKVNARSWKDDSGGQYTTGTIIAGTLTVSKQDPSVTLTPVVDTQSFGSNGGQIAIQCSFSGGARFTGTGGCPATPNPTLQLRLYRVSPSGEVLVQSQSFTGSVSCTVEGGEYIQEIDMNGSFTFYDNLGTTQNRRYRLEATLNRTYPSLSGFQRLSILTQEA